MAIALTRKSAPTPLRNVMHQVALVLPGPPIGLWAIVLATALALLLSSQALADRGPMPKLAIRDYVSPTGEFSVRVDPSDRSGAGPATYNFSRDGQPTLTIEHPFTLVDAVVGDDGVFAGYGYSRGQSAVLDPGDFLVAIMDADGSIRMLERSPRSESPFLHTDPNPTAKGVFVDTTDDRMVVRLANVDINTRAERWWVYRLGSGKRLAMLELSPPDPRAYWIVDAQPLSGTPLTLLHWWHGGSDNAVNDAGAMFTLVDAGGKSVWQLLLPKDYVAENDEAADAIRSDVHAKSAIRIHGPGAFSLHHRREGMAVAYQVTPTGTDWDVVESGRRPWPSAAAPTSSTAENDAVPLIDAVQLGQHQLRPAVAAERTSLGDVRAFAIDARGRFAVVLGQERDASDLRLRVLDVSGATLGEIALAAWFDCRCELHIAAMTDGRWLVASASQQRKDTKAKVIVVTAEGDGASEITGLSAPPFEALAGTENGFIAVTDEWERYTSEQALVEYSIDGSQRWRVDEEYGNKHAISSPEDIAVTADGDVVVLEQISNTLKRFDGNGQPRQIIDLATSWHRKPSYPTEIAASPLGGFAVHDFHGTPSMVRMRADGSVEREFTPKMPDGREIAIRDIDIDPSGALWTTDGYALLRLDDDGIVDHAIGNMPANDDLGDVAATVIANDGRVYVADARTAAVHVFDDAGEPLHVCRPLPDDHNGELDVELAVTELGDVWLQPNSMADGNAKYVHFAPNCERLGIEQLALDTVSQTWLPARGSDNRWVMGHGQIYLIDAEDGVLATRERTSDERWLDYLGSAAVAGDGTLAVASSDIADTETDRFIALFDADAQPLGTLPSPEGFQDWHPLAFDGQRLYFGWSADRETDPTAVTVTDLDGRPLYRLVPSSGRTIDSIGLVRRDGRDELWLFDGKRTIERVALPRP